MTLDPLSRMAVLNGTDKFGYHCYTPNYHKLFHRWRDRELKILEIGVGGYQDEDRGGQSLATWRDYFPKAQVTGIDIQKKVLDFGPRVAIRQGSQVDPDFLAALVAERGPFDLIVDDGSHRNEHVVETFRLLFPTLKPGGIYVVEDVQTSFMPRFGGSLDLAQPNSVGFFRDLIAAPPAGVTAMERFHNMVAIHKAGGIDAGLDRSTAATLPGTGAKVRRLSAAHATPESWRRAFAELPERALLVLDGHPGPALLADLLARFVEVDHREIRHNFPKATPDPVATQLYGIERHAEGWVLIKAPNDYPSNFAFDIDHPQAQATCAAIEAILRETPTEEGLVHYAGLVTAERGREAARDWVAQLDRMEATARQYFLLSGGLAQRDRQLDRAAQIFARALVHFPNDPGFALALGSVLLAQGRPEDAGHAIAAPLLAHPRDANLHLLMARIADAQDEEAQAIDHATKAVTFSPIQKKPRAQAVLGELLLKADRLDEAEAALTAAVADESRHAARAWRILSDLHVRRGETESALIAAGRATDASPTTREYRDWRAKLAG